MLRNTSFALLLVAAAASCSRPAGSIGEQDLVRWLESYGAAWENRDPAAAAALFSNDARYQEDPYAEPYEGRDGIRDYWASVTADQDAIDFEYEVLSVEGGMGIALWSARFRSISGDAPVELNGVFVLDFADPDHVSSLREWWHVR